MNLNRLVKEARIPLQKRPLKHTSHIRSISINPILYTIIESVMFLDQYNIICIEQFSFTKEDKL